MCIRILWQWQQTSVNFSLFHCFLRIKINCLMNKLFDDVQLVFFCQKQKDIIFKKLFIKLLLQKNLGALAQVDEIFNNTEKTLRSHLYQQAQSIIFQQYIPSLIGVCFIQIDKMIYWQHCIQYFYCLSNNVNNYFYGMAIYFMSLVPVSNSHYRLK